MPTSASPSEGTTEPWPALPFDAWQDTCETLHMWTQVVGKVKLALSPFLNQWWEVAFHLTPRGLTTGNIPDGATVFGVEFDFVTHNLHVQVSDGRVKSLPLIPRPVADFYAEFMATLHALGIRISINPVPAEIPHPVPFDQDRTHHAYDPEYANRWWRIMAQTGQVLARYRSDFVGKSSPILFYWGSFDLNATRFSGKPAAPPQGAPRFVQLAEDEENISCGFWPGNITMGGVTLGAPAFYSYTYPEPAGFKTAAVRPAAARYNADLGEFIFQYDDARRAADPAEAILEFFQSTYEAGASLAHWDRSALERQGGQP